MGRALDEDDVRSRPGRGKSRPRTKDRPDHQAALPGMVTVVDRGRFHVAMDRGSHPGGFEESTITAVKARALGRKGVVVGDRVEVMGVKDAGPDSPARIVRRYERSTVLRRSADDADPTERVMVANATQLAVVTAAAHPEPSLGLIDRALIAADDAGIPVLLIVTKTDLASSAPLHDAYAPLGVEVFDVRDRLPHHELRDRLRDQVTVMLGASGVGKSTLVNALATGAQRSTGGVNLVTGKGRHTSTSVQAIPLAPMGWIIDTPGVRSFGLAHVAPEGILRAFPDLQVTLAQCPRDCGHVDHDQAECALLRWSRQQSAAVQERTSAVIGLLTQARQRASFS